MLPNCDCGCCCEQCGHYPGCISNEEGEEEMGDNDARSKSGLATVQEVAADLRVARMTVYRLISRGALGAIRVGRAFRIPEAELAAYKKRSAIGPAEEG